MLVVSLSRLSCGLVLVRSWRPVVLKTVVWCVQEKTPEQELYRDPNVVRAEDNAEDETIVKRSQTASRMLSLFRQMEEQKEPVHDG